MSSPLSESMDQILNRFDEAWNSPTPPRIENFAPPADAPAYRTIMVELFVIDMDYRLRRGEQPSPDEYRQRFPACADAVAACLDEARAAAELAASRDKANNHPHLPPTTDEPPAPPPLALPVRFVGGYELLQPLRSGGQGTVYKARHRLLNKFVALKLVPADPRQSGEIPARFRREVSAAGALEHPNVVEAHDAGAQSGVVYLAMELIDGVDLERLVKQRGPLPIAEACELVRQAALGLDYIHQRHLIHRDVKPANLMRTRQGTVKVLDFGLARWCVEAEAGHTVTGPGPPWGTPDFMAPEQIEKTKDIDGRADLYGLGGTLFYLLTGQAPFADCKTLMAKLDGHRFQTPPDVQTLRPEIPAELAALVRRLLAKKPEERFTTAADVAAALAPFIGKPLPSGGRQPPETSGPRGADAPRSEVASARRRPWLAVAAAGLTLIGLGLLLTYGRSPNPSLSSTSPIDDKPPGPIQALLLNVKLTRNVNGGGLVAGLVGDKIFDPHEGDTVTVEARLTRPAYAFLIAFRPDGVAEVCFPEKEDEPPPWTDRPRYPAEPAAGVEYGLNNGAGLEVFALVASSAPLPSFKEWWTQCPGCPWKKEDAPLGVVYRGNGEDPVEAWNAAGEARGKGVEVKGKTPVARLAAWLRTTPGIETVQVLGFTVGPKEKR